LNYSLYILKYKKDRCAQLIELNWGTALNDEMAQHVFAYICGRLARLYSFIILVNRARQSLQR
jgi:hypothetical protein